MIEKSTYFYSDEESLDPIHAACVWLFTSVWHPFISGCKNCFIVLFFSLWSVNTESTIAINVLYTPYFFMLLRHDAQIFGLIFLNCLFMVSHYISDALDVLFVHMIFFFFFFRSILDGSQYLEKLIHTFFWETSSFLKIYLVSSQH